MLENKERDSNASKSSSRYLDTECKKIDHCPISFEASLERKCSVCDSSEEAVEQELPEAKTGWPVFRKSVLTREKPKDTGTMIQWAMQLPARYSTSSVAHHDRKPPNSKSFSKPMVNGDKDPSVSSVAIHNGGCKLLKELELLRERYSSVCRFFSYKELVDVTSNFSAGLPSVLCHSSNFVTVICILNLIMKASGSCIADKLIGRGGSSWVYKGCLSDGKQLAVKILKPSEGAIKELVSEIEILTTLRHKNIVSLICFCFNKDHLILVYDFLSRGSLEETLHGI